MVTTKNTLSGFATDQILDEILMAEQNGHLIRAEDQPERGLWVGRCDKCGWASVIHLNALPHSYGGILNESFREPCGLARLMRTVGVVPFLRDLGTD